MKKLFLFFSIIVMLLNITIKANAQKNIDCDGLPFLPDQGWKAEIGPKEGTLKFDSTTVELIKIGFHKSEWEAISKKLSGVALNGCVLNHLLLHQNLIPAEWIGKKIFFWGTTYTESSGVKCVLYLVYFNNEWTWEAQYLSEDANNKENNYAIVRKK